MTVLEWINFLSGIATILGLPIALFGIERNTKSINTVQQSVKNFGSGPVQNIGKVENLHITGSSKSQENL